MGQEPDKTLFVPPIIPPLCFRYPLNIGGKSLSGWQSTDGCWQMATVTLFCYLLETIGGGGLGRCK